MQLYEFKVIPAPRKGEKARGVKTTADRFAHALSLVMNELAREGWDYVRADTMPCDERSGLTGKTTTYQTVLVFRRALASQAGQAAPTPAPAPAQPAPAPLAVATDLPGASIAPRLGAARAEEGRSPTLGPAGKTDSTETA